MKSKNRNYTYEAEYEDDYDDKVKGKKLSDHRRRPIKNWKKVWAEHTSDYDEVDDFYTQNRRQKKLNDFNGLADQQKSQ